MKLTTNKSDFKIGESVRCKTQFNGWVNGIVEEVGQDLIMVRVEIYKSESFHHNKVKRMRLF